jgi:hypothetical protein
VLVVTEERRAPARKHVGTLRSTHQIDVALVRDVADVQA